LILAVVQSDFFTILDLKSANAVCIASMFGVCLVVVNSGLGIDAGFYTSKSDAGYSIVD
jgi:hypothetical protein